MDRQVDERDKGGDDAGHRQAGQRDRVPEPVALPGDQCDII